MLQESDNLHLGKGAAFVKSHLKRLRQEDKTWEAAFQQYLATLSNRAVEVVAGRNNWSAVTSLVGQLKRFRELDGARTAAIIRRYTTRFPQQP